jgi:hypothetical protein
LQFWVNPVNLTLQDNTEDGICFMKPKDLPQRVAKMAR